MLGKVRVGVVPAAGPGKRMGYLSQILPKCLFPIYDRPLIHYILDNMKTVGVEEVYVIVNYQKNMVMNYLRSVEKDVGLGLHFLEQPSLSGIAGAIMQAQHIKEPFMVILGDDCTVTLGLQKLVDTFFQKEAVVVQGMVREREEHLLSSTCCVQHSGTKRIIRIAEKPPVPFSKIRGCGVYVFQPDIFSYIARTPVSPIRNEREITDTIGLVAQDKRAYGEFIPGKNVNINSPEDLLRAWLLLRRNRHHSNSSKTARGG